MMPIDYEIWIDAIFNYGDINIDPDEDWPDGLAAQIYGLSPEERLRLIAATFQNADRDLARFSDEQAGGGLNFLVNEASGDWLRLIYEIDIPLQIRLMAIRALNPLYSEFFAQRCEDNLNENRTDRLNWLCYMFWDASVLSFYSIQSNDPNAEHIMDAFFEILENALALPHLACQQSALHGLGHSIYHLDDRSRHKDKPCYLQRVQAIIDDYLKKKNIDERLREYALQARTGMIQ